MNETKATTDPEQPSPWDMRVNELEHIKAELLAACKSIARDDADWLSDSASEMLRAAIAQAEGGAA